jgi:hypothetical protein
MVGIFHGELLNNQMVLEPTPWPCLEGFGRFNEPAPVVNTPRSKNLNSKLCDEIKSMVWV